MWRVGKWFQDGLVEQHKAFVELGHGFDVSRGLLQDTKYVRAGKVTVQ